MKRFDEMTVTERIEETLVHVHGMRSGSAITAAFAVVIFNANSSAMAACNTREEMVFAVSDSRVRAAALVIISIAQQYAPEVKPA